MYPVTAILLAKKAVKVIKFATIKKTKRNENINVEIVDNCIYTHSSFIGSNSLASNFFKVLSDFEVFSSFDIYTPFIERVDSTYSLSGF